MQDLAIINTHIQIQQYYEYNFNQGLRKNRFRVGLTQSNLIRKIIVHTITCNQLIFSNQGPAKKAPNYENLSPCQAT